MALSPLTADLRVAWAQGDITPAQPVLIAGRFHARVSESVKDPLAVSALALATAQDHAVLASCDLVALPDELRDAVRHLVPDMNPPLNRRKVVLCATHTHAGPELRFHRPAAAPLPFGRVFGPSKRGRADRRTTAITAPVTYHALEPRQPAKVKRCLTAPRRPRPPASRPPYRQCSAPMWSGWRIDAKSSTSSAWPASDRRPRNPGRSFARPPRP